MPRAFGHTTPHFQKSQKSSVANKDHINSAPVFSLLFSFLFDIALGREEQLSDKQITCTDCTKICIQSVFCNQNHSQTFCWHYHLIPVPISHLYGVIVSLRFTTSTVMPRLSAFDRSRVVGLVEGGTSYAQVSLHGRLFAWTNLALICSKFLELAIGRTLISAIQCL